MSGLDQTRLAQLLDFAALGDPEARLFLHKIADYARMTDDIADGDAEDPPEAVAMQFNHVFVLMATDPFYERWRGAFVVLLPVLTLLWARTDKLRKHPNRNVRMTGYIYRESIEFATFTVAYLVGGPRHANAVIDRVLVETRESTAETFEDWEKE